MVADLQNPGRDAANPTFGTIEHRAAKVTVVNGLSMLIGVGSQLVSVPVCLHYWGKTTYGSWLALFSAFTLLKGLDGGYTAFVGNKLNYLYHKSALEVRKHLAAAVFGILVISSLQIALVMGAALLEPLSGALGMSSNETDVHDRWGLLILMASWVLTGSYLGIVQRLMIPAGLMYQSAWWAMEFQVCQFGAIMLCAVLRLDMLHTSALFASVQLVSYVASALYVRYKLPGFAPWLRGAEWRTGFSDLGQSAFLTTSNLIQQGALNGSVLLVSALAGPIAVPIFTTVRTLTNLWTTVTTILSTPLLPDIVRMHAKGELQKLVDVNLAYWVLVGSAVNLAAILSFPLIPFLYARWTAHAVALNYPLLCFLLATVVAANSGALMALHLNGINKLSIVLLGSVVRAIFGLGGGALLFRHYGLAGFGMGMLVGEVVASLMTARVFLKYLVDTQGSQIPLPRLRPIFLSTGSVLMYFCGAGIGVWHVGWAWFLEILSVVFAAVWGWRGLEFGLQRRLMGIPRKLLHI